MAAKIYFVTHCCSHSVRCAAPSTCTPFPFTIPRRLTSSGNLFPLASRSRTSKVSRGSEFYTYESKMGSWLRGWCVLASKCFEIHLCVRNFRLFLLDLQIVLLHLFFSSSSMFVWGRDTSSGVAFPYFLPLSILVHTLQWCVILLFRFMLCSIEIHPICTFKLCGHCWWFAVSKCR